MSSATIHLSQTTNPTTLQIPIPVGISPAIDGALDEPSFGAQRRVQIRQRPAHLVALGLIVETVALVLIPVAVGARVDAVLLLELPVQDVHVDRLDVAPDLVREFHPVARVLEGDPLDAVPVLANDQRGGCGNWTRWGTIDWTAAVGSLCR